MFIDNIFIALIALGALRGWWKGFLRTFADICGLITGYVLLWLFSAQAGEFIYQNYGISPTVATMLAGTGMIIGASVIATIIGYLLKKRKVASLSEGETDKFLLNDSYTGAWLGIVLGLLLSCFVALMISILPSDNKFAVYLEAEDSAFVDLMAPLTPAIIDSVTFKVFGDTANAKIAAAIISNPEEAQNTARKIVKSEAVKDLIQSEDFTEMMKSGTAEEIANSQQLQNVLKDPEVVSAFAKLGISEKELQLTPEDMVKIVDGYRQAMNKITEMNKGKLPGSMPDNTSPGIPGNIPQELLSDPEMLPKLMKMMMELTSGQNPESGISK